MMHLFYFCTTVEDWQKAAVTDEELKMLLDPGTPRLYSELLDLMV